MTTTPCALDTQCCYTSIALFVIWLGVASTLLWLTWNRVIGHLVKVKAVKLWQALLLIATISSFVLPCAYLNKKCHEKSCRHSRCLYGDKKDSKESKEDGDCPYSHRSHASDSAIKEHSVE
jgi:hypothetical protein